MDGRLTILHLGMGAFHRAHQAVYMQRLIEAGEPRWKLVSGNIRADQPMIEAGMIAQGGAYTVESVSSSGIRGYQRVESIASVVPYSASLAGLVEFASRPSTRIVSFTVTEAGYHLDEQDRLERSSSELAHDLLAHGSHAPVRTLYGALAVLLDARRRAGGGPATLLNCDNLRQNGARARNGLLQFLELAGDRELGDWVRSKTTWPNSMVDRITPRPTADIRARVLEASGWNDQVPVMAEDFLQWVIEDDFCNGRPSWERVGVEMVETVAPFEEAKIRILNASHSCLAWAGVLAGYDFVHEAAVDPRIRRFAHDYVSHAVLPLLQPSPLDLAGYRDVVLSRFGNAALADRNERVASDGFAKLPGFIAPTLRENLAVDRPIESVAILPALFLAFLQRWSRGELPFDYRDQAMDPVAARAICSAPDPVEAFCGDHGLWGSIAHDARLLAAMRVASGTVEGFMRSGRP